MNTESENKAALIKKMLARKPWSTAIDISRSTGFNVKTVRNHLSNMHMLGRVDLKRQGGIPVWAISEDRAAAAPNVAAPRRINVMSGDYACPELRTDLPPARMAAFSMPSRMGDKLFYRDGRVEVVQ